MGVRAGMGAGGGPVARGSGMGWPDPRDPRAVPAGKPRRRRPFNVFGASPPATLIETFDDWIRFFGQPDRTLDGLLRGPRRWTGKYCEATWVWAPECSAAPDLVALVRG